MFKIHNLANLLTASRFFLGIPVLLLLAGNQPVAAATVFVMGALTDALDGWAARKWGHPTKQGRLLDALADRTFGLLTMVGFFLSGRMNSQATLVLFLWIGGELIVGMAITRVTGEFYLYAEHRQSIRLTACCSYLSIVVLIVKSDWFPFLLATMIALMVLTALDYSIWLYKKARGGTANQTIGAPCLDD